MTNIAGTAAIMQIAWCPKWVSTNPTVAVLEERIAALEGGIGAVATASGQAALHLAIVTLMGQGGHIVSSASIYGGSHNMFYHTLPRFGITATFVDPRDPDAFARAITPDTRLIFGETLGNPGLEVMDLEKVSAIAHDAGIPLMIDNTFATPYLCQPPDASCACAMPTLCTLPLRTISSRIFMAVCIFFVFILVASALYSFEAPLGFTVSFISKIKSLAASTTLESTTGCTALAGRTALAAMLTLGLSRAIYNKYKYVAASVALSRAVAPRTPDPRPRPLFAFPSEPALRSALGLPRRRLLRRGRRCIRRDRFSGLDPRRRTAALARSAPHHRRAAAVQKSDR